MDSVGLMPAFPRFKSISTKFAIATVSWRLLQYDHDEAVSAEFYYAAARPSIHGTSQNFSFAFVQIGN